MKNDKLSILVKNSLDITLKAIEEIDHTELDEFIHKIIKIRAAGKNIFIAASGRSLLVMKSFAMRLMQLDFNVYVVGEVVTPAIEAGDLLIVGSGSGNTKSLVVFAEEAKEKKADIILITRDFSSALVSVSNRILSIPCKLARNKKQSNGSIFEETLLVFLDQCTVLIAEELEYFKRYEDYNAIVKHRHANLQ